MERNLQLNLYSGLLIYRATRNTEFLLYNDTFSNKRHWGPPKGRVIGQEDEKNCGLRAAFEIIGVNPKDLRIEEGFKIEVKYLSGTKPKKVSYYLAQALDPHSRIPPNAEGLHIQWCNLQQAVDKAAFRNMQEVFTHACNFVESKKKARQPVRRKTGDSPRFNYGSPYSPNTAHSEAAAAVEGGVASVKSQLKGLNITSLQESPRPSSFSHQTADAKPTHHAGEHSREQMLDHHDKSGKSLTANPLYKTRLCERFETEKYCPYEGKCTFAHGNIELRERIADAVEDKPSAKMEPTDGNNLFKTRLCERYMKGMFCQYGPKCNFAHGVTELKQRPAPSKESPKIVDDQASKFRMPRTRDSAAHPDYVDVPSSVVTLSQPRVDLPGHIIEKPMTPESPTASLPGKPQTNEFDTTQQDGASGLGKPKLVQYEHKLPPLAKPPTPGYTSRKQVEDKIPLKSALNGMTDTYEKTKIKVVELSKHERDMLPIALPKPKSASPIIVQQEENVIRDLRKYFESSSGEQMNSAADIKEVTRIEMRYNFSKASLFYALFASLLDGQCKDGNSAVTIFKTRQSLFNNFIRNAADQQKLLKAWADYVSQRNSQLLPKTSLVLSYWYSCDLIEEETCIKWYEQLEENSKIKIKSAKFIDWLQTAEEED
ncbi:hypothetical protein BC943DRAFT_80878 [Umbelopsis sp. AD052]|nr:hypothetical protein BC943DRAFT_80878 [Umbelopsis sp. AD052]